MYGAFALFTQAPPPSLGSLADALREHLKGLAYDVDVVDGMLEVKSKGEGFYGFSLCVESGMEVRTSSMKIAAQYARHRKDREAIAASSARVLVNSGEDPELTHFDDFVRVLAGLSSYPGVVLFDPDLKKFMDEA